MGGEKDKERIAAVVKRHYPDARVMLYGSRARGDYYPDSDYDIAVISSEFEDKDEANRKLSKDLHEAIDAPLELVLYTPEEYERGLKGFLPELIEREGVALA